MDMEQQPWELLDIDDSDLPSFIRPKRPFPAIAPCSSKLEVSISSQTLTPKSPISNPPAESAATTEPGPRGGRIPGPAGAVQLAMRRRVEKAREGVEEEGTRGVSTQEYLRKVVESGGDEEDLDFGRGDDGSAWVRAVEFIREQVLVEGDGVSIGTPLCNIRSGIAQDKVPQVVALIKSCTPNGLGDLSVTLKDPTGTISASIHRKVLLDEGFGKDIAVGAALILQKVAVFSPARSCRYLNITSNNIVQVVSKDGRLPSRRNNPAPAINHSLDSVNGNVVDHNETSGMVDEESSQVKERITGIMSRFEERANEIENDFRCTEAHQSEGTQGTDGVICRKRKTFNPNASTDGEHSSKADDVVSRFGTGKTNSEGSNNGVNRFGIARTNFQTCNDNVRGIFASLQDKFCNSRKDFTSGTTECGGGRPCVGVPDDKDASARGKENQKQPSIPKTSLPQWTDEQLDELLEFD